MGTTYDYNYDYEVSGANKNQRTHAGTAGGHTNHGGNTQRTGGHHPSSYATSGSSNRGSNNDPLANLQHDRIWSKLYDPLDKDKATHGAEIQKMARRQDRKVIKLEAAYGSDRQTFIVKRNQDLRVRDVQEDAAKAYKMPVEQMVLYWKGRNICDTPNELLETLGIENNQKMRVCRDEDPAQQSRRRELLSNTTSDQQYPSSNDTYRQPQQQQQPTSQSYTQYQQQYGTTPGANYYPQLPNSNVSSSVAPTNFLVNLQIGIGERVEGIVIGRPYPTTIYDLQIELQQRFNIPVSEQNISYNGTLITQYQPDTPLDALGIVNNSFVSVWYRNQQQQQQQPQQQGASIYYPDTSQQPPCNCGGHNDTSPRRVENTNNQDSMQNNGNQDVLKIEVFHGSDRHILILRSTNNLRISDLMEELQRITTVPVQNQKLFFRGQELQQAKDRTLREAGIDNNAQVRLIGDPAKPRYEAMISGNRPN